MFKKLDGSVDWVAVGLTAAGGLASAGVGVVAGMAMKSGGDPPSSDASAQIDLIKAELLRARSDADQATRTLESRRAEFDSAQADLANFRGEFRVLEERLRSGEIGLQGQLSTCRDGLATCERRVQETAGNLTTANEARARAEEAQRRCAESLAASETQARALHGERETARARVAELDTQLTAQTAQCRADLTREQDIGYQRGNDNASRYWRERVPRIVELGNEKSRLSGEIAVKNFEIAAWTRTIELLAGARRRYLGFVAYPLWLGVEFNADGSDMPRADSRALPTVIANDIMQQALRIMGIGPNEPQPRYVDSCYSLPMPPSTGDSFWGDVRGSFNPPGSTANPPLSVTDEHSEGSTSTAAALLYIATYTALIRRAFAKIAEARSYVGSRTDRITQIDEEIRRLSA